MDEAGVAGRKRDRWGFFQKLFALLTAVLTLVTAWIGYVAATVATERDEIREEQSDLASEHDVVVRQRDRLQVALEQASERIADLEEGPPASPNPEPSDGPPTPDVTYLNELEPVAGSVEIEETALGGVQYRNVVRLRLQPCGSQEAEFNLGKGYTRLTARIGLHDAVEDPRNRWRFIVRVIDDQGERTIFEQVVPFGQVADLDESVRGVVRLRLVVEEFESPTDLCGGSTDHYDSATWADPALHS